MANRARMSDTTNRKQSKQEQAARIAEEQALRIGTIADYDPMALDAYGLKAYERIIRAIPENKIAEVDGYTIEIAADALGKMQQTREIINDKGMMIDGDQNKAVLVYQKYSEIAKKYLVELGCTPSARSKIALDVASALKKPQTTRQALMDED